MSARIHPTVIRQSGGMLHPEHNDKPDTLSGKMIRERSLRSCNQAMLEKRMAHTGDVRDQDAADAASSIRQMRPGDAQIIANAPIPGVTGGLPVVMRYNELMHVHRSHAELQGQESLIVEAIRSPESMFRDPRYANTYGVSRRLTETHDIFVSLEVHSHWIRVKSARIHRQGRTRRLLERASEKYEFEQFGVEE